MDLQTASKKERIAQTVREMEEKLLSPLSTEELGKAVGYSPFHYHDTFRDVTGYSPQDYLRRRRLSCAAEALLKSNRSIEHIGWDAGYESGAAFSKAFKKQYSLSPIQYRKKGESLWVKDTPPIEDEYLIFLQENFDPTPVIIDVEPEYFLGHSLELELDTTHSWPDSLPRVQGEFFDWIQSTPNPLTRKTGQFAPISVFNPDIQKAFSEALSTNENLEHLDYNGTNFDVIKSGGKYVQFHYEGSRIEHQWYRRYIWSAWYNRAKVKFDKSRAVRTRFKEEADPKASYFNIWNWFPIL